MSIRQDIIDFIFLSSKQQDQIHWKSKICDRKKSIINESKLLIVKGMLPPGLIVGPCCCRHLWRSHLSSYQAGQPYTWWTYLCAYGSWWLGSDGEDGPASQTSSSRLRPLVCLLRAISAQWQRLLPLQMLLTKHNHAWSDVSNRESNSMKFRARFTLSCVQTEFSSKLISCCHRWQSPEIFLAPAW